MAFDFPASPTTGQTYQVSGGPTYVYNGTAWQVLTPGSRFNRAVFTATANQTTFSVNYLIGGVDVFRNGVKLAPADFTATSGTSVVLADGCNAGDTVEIVSYAQVNYTNAMQRTGDTMTGDLIFSGTGRRIKGDTVNATLANRLFWQDSGTNTITALGVIPSGTATSSFVQLYNNSSTTNAGILSVQLSSTIGDISVGRSGTGTYLPLSFSTGGNEAARFDTSGNFGIGTTSPAFRTEIVCANNNGIQVKNDGGTTFGGMFVEASAMAYGTRSNTAMRFITNDAERARFTNGGTFLVGTTTTFDGVSSAATQLYSAGGGALALKVNGAGPGTLASFFDSGSSRIGWIGFGSSTTSYNTTSDYRLKTNLEPLTNALARVEQLNVFRFNWLSNLDGPKVDGFIAHEVTPVVPEAVSGEKDAVNNDGSINPQGIDQSKLVPLLTAAIQELKTELDAAKARIAALEGAA